ncbi:MAG: SUMF1/EgtB/PvdO family nonheme iron enzyme [Chitinophagaceae bacterium]|nr:SUMF1/EgtB/PvdO family nonheme iron enzyme [Chitinophagaceae bacterium]
MSIKRSLLFTGVFLIAASSLSTTSTAQDNPNYHKSRTRPVIPYRHLTLAAPPGMVYVPGGSVTIKYSQSSTDTNSKKRVSLSSFYIDKTEVTNQQYRMFTEWVIDSIAIVNYLKDDKWFLDPPPGGWKDDAAKTEVAKVDTTAVKDTLLSALGGDMSATAATTTNATPAATTAATAPVNAVTDSNGRQIRRRINWEVVKHKDIFESNDDEIKAKIAPMFDPVTGKIKEELYTYSYTYLKATGTNKNVKIGEYATESINVYPDEKIWFKDLNNSQVDILVENYFTQPPFDDYPVVGVTWKQARAFAAWRSHTNFDYANIADYLKYYKLQYSLPSEAQWVYAAGKDIKNSNQPVATPEPEPEATPDSVATASTTAPATDSTGAAMPTTDSAALSAITAATDGSATPAAEDEDGGGKKKKKKKKKNSEDEESVEEVAVVAPAKPDKDATPVDKDRNGSLLVNFKQEEGDYTEDGANFTLPVMSYSPNEFGVYNMIGNVAEWVLDAYSPSAFAFVSDVNPVLLYDADPKDGDAMKRKVVRGGSFVSNAKALSPFTRDYELQDNVHCYIGFRCVMSAPEILSKKVATRRRETGSTKPAAPASKQAVPTAKPTSAKAKK